jgi:predicted DNA-binding transcriptional regulator AlpA
MSKNIQSQLNPGRSLSIISAAGVCEKLQISRSQLYAMIKLGLFPRPFKLLPGGRASRWLDAELDDWVLARRESEKGLRK